MIIRSRGKRPDLRSGAHESDFAKKIPQAGGEQPPVTVRANKNAPFPGPEFYMLKGVTAAENNVLQRNGSAIERRLFRKCVKNPAKTLADLCAMLHKSGWMRIKARWCCGLLVIDARIGKKLQAKLRKLKLLKPDDCLFGDFVRAARNVGLRPGIEDVGVFLDGKSVLGTVAGVPVTDMDAALNRTLDQFHGRAKRERRDS